MHLNVLNFRLTRVAGQLVSAATCALTGRIHLVRTGIFAAALGLAPGAQAIEVLIINYALVPTIETNLQTRQVALGNNATIVTSGAIPTNLAQYGQVWDLGANKAISTGYAASLTSYLQGGGTLFMMGENSGYGLTRNNAMTGFMASLGGGTVTVAGNSGNSQTVFPKFQTNNPTSAVSFAAIGMYTSVGTGACITSGCGAAAWAVGTLANAKLGALVSVLDVNFLQTAYLQPAFTDNLISYLSAQQQIAIQGGVAPAADIGTAAPSYNASALGTLVNPAFKGGTLNIDGASMTLAQNFTIGSAGGTVQVNGNAATFGGVVADEVAGTPGRLNIAGSGGAVTLGGTNTYTGATSVGAGSTLKLGGSGSIATSSGVAANGTFDISGTTAGASIASLTGAGAVTLGARTLTLARSAGLFSGGISGSGGIALSGGAQSLSGVNLYTGATGIANGASLALMGSGSIAASSGVTVNGSFDIAATSAGANVASLTGSGNVVLGNQSLTLTNARSTFDGTAGGAGGIGVAGGTQTLTGTHTYSGATNIGSGATLALAGGGSIVASSGVVNAGTLDIAGTTSGASLATLSGAGNVVLGAQTLTLLSASSAFTGSIGGSGGVNVLGGTLKLIGDQAYTGMTTIGSGAILSADGRLLGGVDVQAGAALRGIGSIGGAIMVTSGGKLAPGNSPGVLTTASTVTMAAGSTFEVEINGPTAGNGAGFHDQLNVTGAGHQFLANGATLTLNLTTIAGLGAYTPYLPTLGQSFHIVTAEGGFGGTRFAPIAQPDGLVAGTRLRVLYGTNSGTGIDLKVVPTSFALYSSTLGINRNALSTAGAVDSMIAADDAGTATPAQSLLANTLLGLGAAQLGGALLGLSGEIHGALAAAQPLAAQGLQDTVTKHLTSSASAIGEHAAAWADYSNGDARWSADQVSSSARASRSQLTIGVDVLRNASSRIGAAGSLATTHVDSGSGGTGRLQDNLAVIYAEHTLGGWTADAQVGYGAGHARSSRADPLAAQDPSVYSQTALTTDLATRQSFASAGLRLPLQAAGMAVEPFARIGLHQVKREAGSEAGSTPSALSVGALSAQGTRVAGGVAVESSAKNPMVARYTYLGSLALGHDAGSLVRPAVALTLDGIATEGSAPQVGRGFVQANAYGTWQLTPGAYLYAGISGEARAQRLEKSITVGATAAF